MSKLEQLDNTLIDPAEYSAPSGVEQVASFRMTQGHWALMALALLCLLFIAFITIARSVQVVAVTPSLEKPDTLLRQTADININNWLKLPIGNRVLVLPGSIDVSVRADGFTPLDQVVEIDSERHQEHELVLTRLPGQLDIQLSSVSGETITANVLIDGQPAGEVPGLLEGIDAGRREISVDASLYRSASKSVIVQGKGQTQTLTMTLEPAWAEYQFSTTPVNAEVIIDQQVVGQTPLTIKLEEGSRDLRIQAAGFKAFEQEISVVAQEDLTIPEISLVPADGIIELNTEPANAAVILNGEYRGVSPLSITVAPNTAQKVQIYKAGFRLFERELNLKPDQRDTQQVALQKDRVPVKFSVSPSSAEIYIDGVRRGQGSQTIELNTLPHKVSIRRAGYVSYNLDLIPTRANKQIVSAKLLTKEQHFWAQLPDNYTNRVGHQMKLFKRPGTVSLGSSRREDGRRANEVVYSAELTKHFYVALHETTNKQFRAYQESHNSGNFKRKSLDSGKHPVANVSWQQAALYCNWLSKQENLTPFYTTQSGFVSGQNKEANGYRLLTEVEWAWLARNEGSGVRVFPWGNTEAIPGNNKVGNFADANAGSLVAFTLEDYNDGYAASSPIGRFPANHNGLFDMGGNVSEWVNDWYNAKGNLDGKSSDSIVSDPLGPKEGEFHVVRGGSWAKGYAPQLRLAYRDFGAKGKHDIGFRIARYVIPPK